MATNFRILQNLAAPFNPVESIARAGSVRALQLNNRSRELNNQFDQAKLDEMARQNQERQQVDDAFRAGVTTMPGQTFTPNPGNILSPTVQAPDTQGIDNAKVLSSLTASNPRLAAGMQAQQSDQDFKSQQEHAALVEQLQKIDAGRRAQLASQADAMNKIFAITLQADPQNRPQTFSALVQRAKQSQQIAPDVAEQYPGDQMLQSQAQFGMQLGDILKQIQTKQDQQNPLVNPTPAKLGVLSAMGNEIAGKGLQAARVPVPGVDVPLSPAVEQQKIRITAAGKAAGADAGAPEVTTVDPASGSILAQTGLSMNAFRALVGDTKSLSRDKATRNAANKEAQQFANKAGIDVSTLPSRYAAINKVLQNNIERQNNTQVMENELEGTIQNLSQVANDKDLGKLKIANVFKIWAGQEVNDDLAQQYALHLNQLRNELAAYNAATQGRTGGSITVQDVQEAERTIKNGISAGSLKGLETAVQNSTKKMGSVMQNSVDAANKSVWDLFGVGKNFKSKNNNEPKPDPLGIR